MPPKLNRRRALFVLGKIDEILAWEQRKETERDTKFVELGRYLCEVRAGQYWRLEKLEVLRRVSGEAFSGIAEEGVLPDVDPRTPAAAGEKAAEGSGLDEGDWSWPSWRGGTGSTSIVQPGCTKPVRCRRRSSSRRSRRN